MSLHITVPPTKVDETIRAMIAEGVDGSVNGHQVFLSTRKAQERDPEWFKTAVMDVADYLDGIAVSLNKLSQAAWLFLPDKDDKQ